MNGSSARKFSSGSSQDPRYGTASSFQPSTTTLVDGYKTSLDSAHGYGRQSSSPSVSSRRWKSSDPVSMHLLMETAMGDSRDYEVLSPEDIDVVKKKLSLLSTRIESTKRKLVLETKVRDAGQSISRLNGGGQDAARGHWQMDGQGSATEAEARESARKCDELSQDLWNMEKQEQELSRRLLEHTAGVLQVTHKGYLKKEPTAEELGKDGGLMNGQDLAEFGDLSHYRPYSQANTLNGDVLDVNGGPSSAEFSHQTNMILGVEKRVEELNARLRDMILELKPRKEDLPQPPRELKDDEGDLEKILLGQVNFLDQCLDTMHHLQSTKRLGLEHGSVATEEKLELFNTQLYQTMMESNPEQASKFTPPPDASGESLQDQLDYMEGGLGAVGKRLNHLGNLVDTHSTKLLSYQDRAEKYVTVIGKLWDLLTAAERKFPNPNQKSGYRDDDPDDGFSLTAFASRVEDLHARSAALSEQKDVLTRQVQQQRDLNDQTDTAKDNRMNSMREELEATKQRLEAKNTELQMQQGKLNIALAELVATKEAMTMRERQSSVGSEALEKEMALRQRAEADAQRMLSQMEEARERAAVMQVSTLALKSDLDTKATAAAQAESTVQQLEGEMARLQTELTITKAELDGVHGTRAQRAAEQAGDPKLLQEKQNLQVRVKTLQDELRDTIVDYEAMTKATIEYEREREQLENVADGLRNRMESLEIQLADEKVAALSAKSPGSMSNSGSGNSTSAGVLKNEFKKMMRETRLEHQKVLKGELEERRKLEVLVRSLKKDQVAGRLTAK